MDNNKMHECGIEILNLTTELSKKHGLDINEILNLFAKMSASIIQAGEEYSGKPRLNIFAKYVDRIEKYLDRYPK